MNCQARVTKDFLQHFQELVAPQSLAPRDEKKKRNNAFLNKPIISYNNTIARVRGTPSAATSRAHRGVKKAHPIYILHTTLHFYGNVGGGRAIIERQLTLRLQAFAAACARDLHSTW